MSELTKEQFVAKYRPMIGTDGEFARFTFFSKSEEHRAQCNLAEAEGRVWTLQDKDGGLLILPGRCAYPVEMYITEVPHPEGDDDYVVIRDCSNEEDDAE